MGEDRARLCALQCYRQVMAVKNVVAKHEGAFIRADEISSDQKNACFDTVLKIDLRLPAQAAT